MNKREREGERKWLVRKFKNHRMNEWKKKKGREKKKEGEKGINSFRRVICLRQNLKSIYLHFDHSTTYRLLYRLVFCAM